MHALINAWMFELNNCMDSATAILSAHFDFFLFYCKKNTEECKKLSVVSIDLGCEPGTPPNEKYFQMGPAAPRVM